MVERALVERVWSPYAEDDPIEVQREGMAVEVRWLGSDTDGVANPTLRRLLRAIGGFGQLAEDSARIADRVEALGGAWDGEEWDGEDRVIRVELPSQAVVHPKPVDELEGDAAPVRAATAGTVEGKAPEEPLRFPCAPPPPATTPSATRPPAAPDEQVTPYHQPASEREAAVLALVDAHGQVTSRDVIEQLGWTRSTTRDVIARMVTAGRLASVAASSRSPFQAYVRR